MAVRFKRLNQRVVVITGASGIGLVTARAAAERAHGWPCISQPRRIAIVKRGITGKPRENGINSQ
jgi:NADP-dependent 3-hydroxy acid dehydrogenase YdfG